MAFATAFIEQALAASNPTAAFERDVVTKHFESQYNLAKVEVSRAVKQIADDINELKDKDPDGNKVAILVLEKLMASMV